MAKFLLQKFSIHSQKITLLLVWTICLSLLMNVYPVAAQATITGDLRLWHKVTLTFTGPDVTEADVYNPFTNYRMDVTFTHSSGSPSVTVPGFYAADGDAANSGAAGGDQWQVRFMPTQIGTWNYTVAFYEGPDVAIATNPTAVAIGNPAPDGETGSFTILDTDKSAPDFRYHGLLQYINEHYMQFAGSGEYFLKNGADSPENFFAYDDFDGTYDTGGIINGFLHSYAPHAGDWNTGDPEWAGGRGHNIIGAINYLSSQDVNSIYVITYTIDGGDGGDTWVWTSDTERERFDVSKLDQWEIVFDHMTQMGLQIHLVTQEIENDELLGGDGTLNDVRRLYYRELVARFAHHPALQWNIGEENDNTDAQRNQFSQYIRSLDPYDHPTVVHTYYNLRENFASGPLDVFYDGLIGSTNFEGTSLQGDATNYNRWAIMFRQQSAAAGQPWVIYGDEQGPAVASDLSNITQIIRDAMWGNLLGGGAGAEWYFGYQGCCFGDLQQESWRVAQPLWQRADIAIDFFRAYLPFWEMESANAITSHSTGASYTFAKTDEVYAAYFSGGAANSPTMNLGNSQQTYDVFWFNPIVGSGLQKGSVHQVVARGAVSLGVPPGDASGDWVALLQIGTPVNEVPVFVDIADTTTVEGGTLNIGIEVIDDDPAITLTAEVTRDSDSTVMTNAFYNLNDQLNGLGLIQFTPAVGESGTYTVRLTADDGVHPMVELFFTLNVLQINEPGILLVQGDGYTRTSEAGLTDTIEVYLNSQPTDIVTIDVLSSDTTEIVVNPVQLTFDDTNWNIPQVVTIIGQDDTAVDGNTTVVLTFDSTASLDATYAGLANSSIVAVNRDNDKHKNNKDDDEEDEDEDSAVAIGASSILLDIIPNADVYVLGSIVDWQVEITNNSGQVITDIEAKLKFSSDDVFILSTRASKGELSSDVIALQVQKYRSFQDSPNLIQARRQPRVNYTHTDIYPGETLVINIHARLDKIPTSATVTLGGQLTVAALSGVVAEDEETLPVVSILPLTGETPWWYKYTTFILIIAFLIVVHVVYSKMIRY